jgi:8-oxo-dGTP diphosphatase
MIDLDAPPPLTPDPPRYVVGVAGMVYDADGRVLLVRTVERGWEPPGGHVEVGEDLVTALAREIGEECGCRVTVDRLLGVYTRCDRPYFLLVVFQCSYVDGELCPSEETPEVAWFAPEAARQIVSPPPIHFPLRDAFMPGSSVVYRAYAEGAEVRFHDGQQTTGPGTLGVPPAARLVDERPRHIVSVAGSVRDAAGRILLVRTGWRGWEPPGGQVEQGEDLLTAVQREIHEESGCTVRVGPLIGVYCNVGVPHIVQFLFDCAYLGGDPTASAETPEVAWFASDAALALATRAPTHARLIDALQPAPGLVYRVYRTRPAYALLGERRLGG